MSKIYEVMLSTSFEGFCVQEIPQLHLSMSGETFIPDYMFHFMTDREVPKFYNQDSLAEWLRGEEVITNPEVADEMWGAL